MQQLAPVVHQHLPASLVHFDRSRVVAQETHERLLQVRNSKARRDRAQNAAGRKLLADVRVKQRVDAIRASMCELKQLVPQVVVRVLLAKFNCPIRELPMKGYKI